MIPEEIIDRVRLTAKVAEVVEDSGVHLRTEGRTLTACCPFHSEKTPSFKVSPSKNTWHCYGSCQEGGDAISYVMKRESLSFIDAVKFLAKRYNIDIEEERESEEQKQARLRREALLALNHRVMMFFVSNLLKSKEPLAYIEKRFN